MFIFYAAYLLHKVKSDCDLKGRLVKNIKSQMEMESAMRRNGVLEPFPCDMIVTSKAGSSNWSLMNWRRQSSSFLDPRVTNLPFFPAGADVWGEMTIIFTKLCSELLILPETNLAYEVPVLPAFGSVALWIKDRILVIT